MQLLLQRLITCHFMQQDATDHNMNEMLRNMWQLIPIWIWCYAKCWKWSQYESDIMQHVANDHNMSVTLCNMLHTITLWVWSYATCGIRSHYECDVITCDLVQHVAYNVQVLFCLFHIHGSFSSTFRVLRKWTKLSSATLSVVVLFLWLYFYLYFLRQPYFILTAGICSVSLKLCFHDGRNLGGWG